MEKQDITIVCSDCQTEFLWSEGEQIFYEENQLLPPKRCKDCRKARKAASKKND